MNIPELKDQIAQIRKEEHDLYLKRSSLEEELDRLTMQALLESGDLKKLTYRYKFSYTLEIVTDDEVWKFIDKWFPESNGWVLKQLTEFVTISGNGDDGDFYIQADNFDALMDFANKHLNINLNILNDLVSAYQELDRVKKMIKQLESQVR